MLHPASLLLLIAVCRSCSAFTHLFNHRQRLGKSSLSASISSDAQANLMMDALRGKMINDDDRQASNVQLQLVEVSSSSSADDSLPYTYDPAALESYFSKRPQAVLTRLWQIFSVSFAFLVTVLMDFATGRTVDLEVRRAAQLRSTIVSLGPFFIKLGQALSIRPDILSPRAMVELQQLCDKVPCFDNNLAMRTIESELGRPVGEVFSEISTNPVAAASLGQVYRARLAGGDTEVAVKVQRPFVLETVSLDLFLVRKLGLVLRRFPSLSSRLDLVALLDEFANNFYQELDYRIECENGLRVLQDMQSLPRVLVPEPHASLCTRRLHVARWVSGEKLSQSQSNDVSSLVNLGVLVYLTQLLDTGFFHADPHPGNMLRTDDGRLVILDFGLMTRVTEAQRYALIEAIAHLIHRDYQAIAEDFVQLGFIPEGTDLRPIVPALTRVFDAALAGGGAKSINFQELASDLADITFRFPFRIPPYFALVIPCSSLGFTI
jgi:aarF domain-containing kinase